MFSVLGAFGPLSEKHVHVDTPWTHFYGQRLHLVEFGRLPLLVHVFFVSSRRWSGPTAGPPTKAAWVRRYAYV